MKKTIIEIQPATDSELQGIAQLLSNSHSRSILNLIKKSGYGVSSNIIQAIGLSQSAVSKQLKRLTAARLVKRDRLRSCTIYSLGKEAFNYYGIEMAIWLEA